MLQSGSYEYICRTPEEIPEQAYSRFRREIGILLGEPIDKMFPAFSQAFPLTVSAMGANWSKPIAGFEQRPATKNWLYVLFLEKQNLNLFFGVRSNSYPLDGTDYDQDHAMLPTNWKELYRWFESFVITADSVKPMGWLNTPFSFSARLDLNDYCKQIGAPTSKGRDFRKKIDSHMLKCWLLTDVGDALFLDELRCDHKVYHVRGAAFDDACVLNDPEATLDKYLAHYVSGGSPAEFDFRE